VYDEDGKKIEVEDSEESDDPNSRSEDKSSNVDKSNERKGEEGENHDEYEKKRRTKTKKEIEKEALESDYYKILNLEGRNDATLAEINKAYKKITLKYHPDKIAARGEELTESAKEVWLKI